jgi:hypothetical protein
MGVHEGVAPRALLLPQPQEGLPLAVVSEGAFAAGAGDVVQGLGGLDGGLGVKSGRHEEREAKTPW